MSDAQQIIFAASVLMNVMVLISFAFNRWEKADRRRRDEQNSRDQIEQIQADLRKMREDIIRIGRGN